DDKVLIWAPVLAGSLLVVLAPAWWNGFPFMFYDTASFLEQALGGGFRPERSVFYAWFLAAFRPSVSLWPAMAAQALMTVLVMAEFARSVVPGMAPGRFFVTILALSVGTA